jgi:hypothetical protein
MNLSNIIISSIWGKKCCAVLPETAVIIGLKDFSSACFLNVIAETTYVKEAILPNGQL